MLCFRRTLILSSKMSGYLNLQVPMGIVSEEMYKRKKTTQY